MTNGESPSSLSTGVAHMRDRSRHVVLAHGGGGQLTDQLVSEHVLPRLGNDVLDELLDAAALSPSGDQRVAMTIDSYVVQPWKFPGGNIGHLAISGTVNDLAVAGATPVGIALSLILCEGFAKRDLDEVLQSVGETAKQADVRVVTGDTKVVGRGGGDDIFITTAGVGYVPGARTLGPRQVKAGDVL
ncbi:MAG: AIR synthase related protein, partial [Rhodospirillales bacterium]|nr:AIR synthase related protein [Rhodospirillales bacterium]